MSEQFPSHAASTGSIDKLTRITRRTILVVWLSQLSLHLSKDSYDSALSFGNQFNQLPEPEYETLALNESLPSKEYVDDLLDTLKNRTEQVPLETITANLCTIYDPYQYGTCLQIDEGGIYLTARHVVADVTKNGSSYNEQTIRDHNDGLDIPISAFIYHPRADIALAFAPTGKPYKAMPGIRFAQTAVHDEPAHMVSLLRDPGKLALYVDDGEVNLQDESPHFRISKKSSVVIVDDMKAYHGNSGGPIVDNSGAILGVASRIYRASPEPDADEKGTLITSIDDVYKLTQFHLNSMYGRDFGRLQ